MLDDELGYKVSYTEALRDVKLELANLSKTQLEMKEDLRRALTETTELKGRVRALELRFYGILAGLMTAAAVLFYNGGGIQ